MFDPIKLLGSLEILEIEKIISFFDVNSDKNVTISELQEVAGKLLSPKQITELIEQWDINLDKNVNITDFYYLL